MAISTEVKQKGLRKDTLPNFIDYPNAAIDNQMFFSWSGLQ